MINYTCAKCNNELTCIKNNIPLIHFNNNNKKDGIDALRYGDLYRCSKCRCQVVIGLSERQILGIDLTKEQTKRILKGRYIEVKRGI